MGLSEKSGGNLIGTPNAVAAVRSIRRKAGEDRWQKELLRNVRGTPFDMQAEGTDHPGNFVAIANTGFGVGDAVAPPKAPRTNRLP